MLQKIKEAAKTVAALVGALLTAGTYFIPADWAPWLALVVAVATAVATYRVPNAAPVAQNALRDPRGR